MSIPEGGEVTYNSVGSVYSNSAYQPLLSVINEVVITVEQRSGGDAPRPTRYHNSNTFNFSRCASFILPTYPIPVMPATSISHVNNLTIKIGEATVKFMGNVGGMATGGGAVRVGVSMITKNSYVRAKAIEATASLLGDYAPLESQLSKHLSDGLPRYEITRPK